MASWHTIPGSKWTVSEAKSAFQKLIRRRDPRAVRVAELFLRAGGSDLTAFLRRLPVIAVEEGMHSVAPAASDLAFSAGAQAETVAQLTHLVVGALLGTPRDKDPSHLMGYVLDHGPAGLTGVEREAWEWGQNLTPKRAQEAFVECWQAARGEDLREILSAMRRRLVAGVMDWDLGLFVGTALALRAREEAGVEPVIFPMQLASIEDVQASNMLDAVDELPWWTLDPHTALGKTVLTEIVRQSPAYDRERAFAVWFRMVSDQLQGYVEREGWRGKRIAEEITDADRRWWASVEPFVQRRIEELIARKTVRPLHAPHAELLNGR